MQILHDDDDIFFQELQKKNYCQKEASKKSNPVTPGISFFEIFIVIIIFIITFIYSHPEFTDEKHKNCKGSENTAYKYRVVL